MINRRSMLATGLATLAPLPASASEPIIVPLHVDEDGRPYVKASFNGHGPYNLMLTTGTASYNLHWDLADEAGLKKTGGLWEALVGNGTYGTTGDQQAIKYRADEVVFEGGYRLTRVNVSGSPPSRPKPDAFRRDGAVGTDFVTSSPCRIDFVKGQIAFYLSGGLPVEDLKRVDDTSWSSMDYPFASTDILVQSGDSTISCIMDTASRLDLYVSSEVIRKSQGYANMDPSKYVKLPFYTNAPERGTVRVVRRTGYAIAGASFDVINVGLGDPGMEDGLETFDVFAVVGGSLLRQFDIAFDGKGGIYMKPNANFKPVSEPIDPNR